MEEALNLLRAARTEEALERLKRLLSTVEPRDLWRVHELIGAAFHDLGDPDGAAQAYFNAAMNDRYLRAQRQHFSNYLFNLHYLPNVEPAALAREHFIYNSLCTEIEPLEPRVNRRGKIAVGYIAPNFLQSAAARFYEPLLTLFDRERFYVICLSLSNETDRFTSKLKRAVDEFIVLDDKNFSSAAKKIAELGLDILFDLGGHSEGGSTLQIMAHRPAPIQVVGIGWFDTTGLDAIDYILADRFLSPRGAERFFSEKFLMLERALIFTPTVEMIPRVPKRRSETTFGCFNNFMKITDEWLECAAAILARVPNSRLILQDTTRIPARQRRMIERVQTFFPLDRIEIRLGRDDWLEDYAEVDVMLDTFPYNGCAMTATALCMNVPVLSLAGDRYGARFGADVLRAASLDELIVEDRESFIERAIELASDPPRNVFDRIKDSALLDARSFVREIERACQNIIEGRI